MGIVPEGGGRVKLRFKQMLELSKSMVRPLQ